MKPAAMDCQQLRQQLQLISELYGLPAHWLDNYPHLFSAATITISALQLQQIQEIIAAVEHVVNLPVYQQKVLSWAAPSALITPKNPAVFMAYDFHLTPTGPKLIEINTNAGGAGFNALLAWAAASLNKNPPANFTSEDYFFSLFIQEWQAQRDEQALKQIAIIDEAPQQQYLYPEFLFFQNIFNRHNIATVIADPSEFSYQNGHLTHQGVVIDLVYNRLTDFNLTENTHSAILNAYADDAIVLTPHPRAYALYADKRNLTVLSDPTFLRHCQLDDHTLKILEQGIPYSFIVDPEQADSLWESRKTLFFKPFIGHGSKGVYRGDKVTKRVFAEILQGDYMAQTLAPPSETIVLVDDASVSLKYDIRNFVYAGQPDGLASRLYQGQATNFRTPGGGFALVEIQTT